MAKHLAETSWETVDRSADPSAFVTYLDRLDASALMHAYRLEFIDRLPLQRGQWILDAGCGTGADALELRDRVGSDGWVAGLDASRQMVHRAREIASEKADARPSYAAGDIRCLPTVSDRFDGVICNRVLMHLRHSLQALKEMVRALKPGGWIALCEPDCSLMKMEPEGRASQAILATHCASFENGTVGAMLGTLVKATGCRVVEELERRPVMRDLEVARSMLNLERSVTAAEQSGALTQDEIQSWRSQIATAAKSGSFRLQVAARICIGRKAVE